MNGRIIALADRVSRNGHVASEPTPIHLHEWDVDVVAMLTIDRGDGTIPNVACVRWTIALDPQRQRLDVNIQREDMDYPLILRDHFRIGESAARTAQRVAVLRFVNDVLSASYGVPA